MAKLAKAAKGEVKSAPKKQAVSASVEASSKKKPISQKLLESLEKRKQQKQGAIGKPMGRRGRKPKNLADYQPENREEESYVLESENERLEYDTGIRVKNGADEKFFNVERFESYDEELNFDW